MKIPLSYNARSLLQRPVSTAFTALGIALVVAVFIGMLALANGFRAALVRTGSAQNILVLRDGADNELSSSLDRQTASILSDPRPRGRGRRRAADGEPRGLRRDPAAAEGSTTPPDSPTSWCAG